MRVHWGLGLGLLLIGAACAGMPGIGGPASEEASDEAIGSTPSGDGASEKATRSKNRNGSPPAGITALGDGSWQVDRNLVRKWQDRPERLAAGSQKDRGFMLRKVGRKDARFLGFENRDLLLSINGRSLGSPAEAALAYAQLKGADTLTVRFRRRGDTRTHTYQIVD